MIRTVALAAALAAASPAMADGPFGADRVSVLMGSYHVDAQAEFNEVNPGLFLTWDDLAVPGRISLGAFRNSFGDVSAAAVYDLPVFDWDGAFGDGELSVFAGLAHYPNGGYWGEAQPLAGLRLTAGNVFVQAMPSDGKAADAILAVGITFELGE